MNKKKTLIIVVAAAVVLVGVMFLLIFLPNGGADNGAASPDEAPAVELSVDADGIHQVHVERDKDGKIAGDTSGALMEYVPADIKTVHLENSKGTLDVVSETPEGEATVYTIKGLEEFDIQTGVPDYIASASSSLKFISIAGLDDGGSEFGFDKPVAVATVTYTDDTKSIITIGNDAPQSKGTYVKFGSGDEIYLVDSEMASYFSYGVTDLISLTINDSAEDVESGQASSISITVNGESIELEPNTDEKSAASYVMTSPVKRYANEAESSYIEGGIRGLYALRVVMVNPSDKQLGDLGLSSPYATLKAVYPDTTVELIASKPDSEGNVNLMIKGGKVVYSIAASSVAWVNTSYEKLVNEYVLYPRLISLTNMKVNDYNFKLSSKTVTTTDNEGEETTSTVTTVYLDDEEIQIENFSGFYDEVSLIELTDADGESASGNAELTITYTYSDGTTDKVEFYSSSNNRYVAKLNGNVMGHAKKADITRVLNDVKKFK